MNPDNHQPRKRVSLAIGIIMIGAVIIAITSITIVIKNHNQAIAQEQAQALQQSRQAQSLSNSESKASSIKQSSIDNSESVASQLVKTTNAKDAKSIISSMKHKYHLKLSKTDKSIVDGKTNEKKAGDHK